MPTVDSTLSTFGIAAIPLQAQFDTSDDLLNPTRGYRLKLNLSPETSVQGSVRPYVRSMVEGTYYQPINDRLVIAGRARFGSIAGVDRDDLDGQMVFRVETLPAGTTLSTWLRLAHVTDLHLAFFVDVLAAFAADASLQPHDVFVQIGSAHV